MKNTVELTPHLIDAIRNLNNVGIVTAIEMRDDGNPTFLVQFPGGGVDLTLHGDINKAMSVTATTIRKKYVEIPTEHYVLVANFAKEFILSVFKRSASYSYFITHCSDELTNFDRDLKWDLYNHYETQKSITIYPMDYYTKSKEADS